VIPIFYVPPSRKGPIVASKPAFPQGLSVCFGATEVRLDAPADEHQLAALLAGYGAAYAGAAAATRQMAAEEAGAPPPLVS
jgi:hypothetical protein